MNRPLLHDADEIVGCVSGFTVAVKFCVALKAGVPLSVTFSEIKFVVSDCETIGRQTKFPFAASSVAFAGALNKLNVNVCGGKSVSVALAVNAMVWPTFTV